MQKRWTALVAVMLQLLVVAPLSGVDFRRVSAAGDFTVSDDGLLTEYTGSGGHVTIPSEVKRIHTGAFHSNTKITGVTFPTTLTEIDPYVFRGCTGLTSVEFPSSLITIGDHAFYECSNLTSVKLSVQLTTIGNGAFAYCPKLTKFDTASCTRFKDEKGVLYRNWASVVAAPAASVVSINSGATSIQEEAFEGNTNLRTVSLSTNMKTVGAYAFRDCSYMYSVNLPDSVTSVGKGAFSGCEALPSISVSKNLTKLPEEMFKNCTALTSVKLNAGTTGIGISAFEGCTALTSIRIPDGMTYIGSSAFAKTSLTSATLSDNVQLTAKNTGIFANCPNLKKVRLSRSATVIPESMFYNCPSLTSIDISSTVTTIGGFAFAKTGLTSVALPNATLGESAFEGCTALRNLVIPAANTSVSTYLVAGCTSLKTVTIPSNVTSIGRNAFDGCSSLKTVFLPSGIRLIAADTFRNCTSLTGITIPANVTTIGAEAFLNCMGLKTVTVRTTDTLMIRESAFKNCAALNTFTMPEKINVKESAFYGCESLPGTIELSNVQTKIEDYTFYNCKKLQRVYFDSVTDIGAYAFAGCESIDDIYLYNDERVISYGEGAFMGSGLTWITLSDQEKISDKAFMNCAKLARVTTSGRNTAIGNSAFEDCTALTSIVLTPKVGNRAFYGCTAMKTLYGSSQMTTLGASAFEGCTALTTVSFASSLTLLPNRAFYGCKALTKIDLSHTAVKTIGNCAFFNCSAATAISLPDTLTTISYGAFYGCNKTTGVTIPKATTYVGSYAFICPMWVASDNTKYSARDGILYNKDYTELLLYPRTKTYTSLLVSTGVKTVGSYAFYGATNLNTVYFPDSVTKIDTFAFYGCTNLTTVRFTKNIREIKVYAFSGCKALDTVNYTGTQAQWDFLMASGFYTTGNEAIMNARRLVVNFGKTVSAMTVKALPAKKVYTVGETFNPAGMTLNVTYTDGFKDVITKGYTYTPTGAMDSLGNQKIVVSYGGKSTGFYVTVNPKGKTVSSMAVKTLPAKRDYTVGETFDPTGMTLKITYSDSSTAIVSSGFSCTPVGKFTAPGQQKMVVNYAGKTTGFYVTVNKAVSSVVIKTKPTKQTYMAGEYFESAGMVLKVTYSDNTTAEVTSGYGYTPTGKLTTAGQQKIVVSYGGKSTGFYVTVNSYTQ